MHKNRQVVFAIIEMNQILFGKTSRLIYWINVYNSVLKSERFLRNTQKNFFDSHGICNLVK